MYLLSQPSMAQVRQQLTEYVVLPLGSKEVHTKAPLLKSVLLYGAAATGKTLLTHAAAAATGATFFNLSPRNTDSKYPGSAVKLLIHMVFKVSRTMAPAVIYIDEAEKVFVSDKKKVKEFGTKEAPGRIRIQEGTAEGVQGFIARRSCGGRRQFQSTTARSGPKAQRQGGEGQQSIHGFLLKVHLHAHP